MLYLDGQTCGVGFYVSQMEVWGMVGGLLVSFFHCVGRASCGATCYFHSCSGCGLGVEAFGGWAGSRELYILFACSRPSGGSRGLFGRRGFIHLPP
jgi:hypothetical protein